MRCRASVVASLAISLLLAPAASSVELEELRPGLVARCTDAGKPPVEVVRLESSVGLNWKASETAHPRLAAEGNTTTWTGYVNLLRAGNYRFTATIRGKVSVRVAGKEVLAGEHLADQALPLEGAATALEAGPQMFTVLYARQAGAGRLELRWEGPGFRNEPLPYHVLFHDPRAVPEQLAIQQEGERGRFLFEELSCKACHQAGKPEPMFERLASRSGPILTKVAGRAYPGWIYNWLLDPQKVRPGAVMPALFGRDDVGRAEAYAVTRFLTSLGNPPEMPAKPDEKTQKALQDQIEQGKKLFVSTGCIACHDAPGTPAKNRAEEEKPPARLHGLLEAGAVRTLPLGALGSKTSDKALAAYLQNPLAVDPSGRMPNMNNLPAKTAESLARYLTASRDDLPLALPEAPPEKLRLEVYNNIRQGGEDPEKFRNLPDDIQWSMLGQRLFSLKGCSNCHELTVGNQTTVRMPAGSFESLHDPATHQRGCLAEKPLGGKVSGPAPVYPLSLTDRKALGRFLTEGAKGAGSPAPAYQAQAALQRFNCLACHSRNGEGGLNSQLVGELRRYEKVENAEDLLPPTLTGVGHKLRSSWFRAVLVNGQRARPWMSLVMPQYGEPNVGVLPEALTALDGAAPDDTVAKPETTGAQIEAGRVLVGKSGFGCISCHDLAGIPNSGTRGPDLATSVQRVRHDWYTRWMWDAQRMAPGTRMPTVFAGGQTLLPQLLGGKAEQQAEAMWVYMALGQGLPLPEGITPKGKSSRQLALQVGERPFVLRTFMPQAGARSFAVGFPGGVSLAYDAHACRTAYSWAGGFLDATPVWEGRGGQPAELLGTRLWTAPAAHPWALTGSAVEVPDFTERARDPALGAPQTEKVFKGTRQLSFQGYTLDRAGYPTFKSRLGAEMEPSLEVRERPQPLQKAGAGFGVRRSFTLKQAGKQTLWFLAAEQINLLRVIDARGNPVTVDASKEMIELSAVNHRIILNSGDRAVVVVPSATPEGTTWVLRKTGSTWAALLRLPARNDETGFVVDVWSPFKDVPGLIKDLLAGR